VPRRFTRPYPPEFRAEAIRLVREAHVPISDAARDLGISGDSIRGWIKQADLDAGVRKDGLTTEERAELNRLRRENRVLREEREILKKPRPSSPGRRARPGSGVRVRRGGGCQP
jgi:transposase